MKLNSFLFLLLSLKASANREQLLETLILLNGLLHKLPSDRLLMLGLSLDVKDASSQLSLLLNHVERLDAERLHELLGILQELSPELSELSLLDAPAGV